MVQISIHVVDVSVCAVSVCAVSVCAVNVSAYKSKGIQQRVKHQDGEAKGVSAEGRSCKY